GRFKCLFDQEISLVRHGANTDGESRANRCRRRPHDRLDAAGTHGGRCTGVADAVLGAAARFDLLGLRCVVRGAWRVARGAACRPRLASPRLLTAALCLVLCALCRMGGFVALHVALVRAARVRRLVLVATAARPPARPPPKSASRLTPCPRISPRAIRSASSSSAPILRPLQVVLAQMKAVSPKRFNLVAKLPDISVPTFVIHACDDAIVPVKYGDELAKGIPGALYWRLESGGHLVYEDGRDGESVANRLISFLDDPVLLASSKL
ncbi:hypothetical protein HK100_010673, partial [Physocladia obscura]